MPGLAAANSALSAGSHAYPAAAGRDSGAGALPRSWPAYRVVVVLVAVPCCVPISVTDETLGGLAVFVDVEILGPPSRGRGRVPGQSYLFELGSRLREPLQRSPAVH